MKIFIFFIIYGLTLIISDTVFSKDVFESDYVYVEVKTINANQTKEDLINEVKNITFLKLLDRLLNNNYKKKLSRKIDANIVSDQLINNIIIENEIITNEKYIANIKINFNKKKIINLFLNNKIKYTDIKTEPFLVISSYNLNFVNVGLDKENLFNNYLQNMVVDREELIGFVFPYLDPNDRYILPYEKIIRGEIKSFNKILDKYDLNSLIYINISQSDKKNYVDIDLKIYNNDSFEKIGKLNLNINNMKKLDKLFNFITTEVYNYLIEWWKNKYLIDINIYNIVECKVSSDSFDGLVEIKSIINNLSQVTSVSTKKIQLNSNVIEIYYYGDLNILIKSLSLSNIIYKDVNRCNLSLK